jgi:hypothetical protein
VHESKLKHKKLKWYTWENLKTPKDACLNLNPNSIYIGIWIYNRNYQESIWATQTELVPVHLCPLNSTFDLDCTKIWKYLDLLEDAKSIDRSSIDQFLYALWIDRSHPDRSKLCRLKVDRSKCLGQFFNFLGSTSNSVNDQITLDLFSGLIQVFWTRFQLRPENKT